MCLSSFQITKKPLNTIKQSSGIKCVSKRARIGNLVEKAIKGLSEWDVNNRKETENPREREEQEPGLRTETDFSWSMKNKASGSEIG